MQLQVPVNYINVFQQSASGYLHLLVQLLPLCLCTSIHSNFYITHWKYYFHFYMNWSCYLFIFYKLRFQNVLTLRMVLFYELVVRNRLMRGILLSIFTLFAEIFQLISLLEFLVRNTNVVQNYISNWIIDFEVLMNFINRYMGMRFYITRWWNCNVHKFFPRNLRMTQETSYCKSLWYKLHYEPFYFLKYTYIIILVYIIALFDISFCNVRAFPHYISRSIKFHLEFFFVEKQSFSSGFVFLFY